MKLLASICAMSLLSSGLATADDFRLLSVDLNKGSFDFINTTVSAKRPYGASRAWLMFVYGQGKSPFVGAAYTYLDVELDCSSQRSRMVKATNYTAVGAPAGSLDFTDGYTVIEPESVLMSAFRVVCNSDVEAFEMVPQKSSLDIVKHVQSLK